MAKIGLNSWRDLDTVMVLAWTKEEEKEEGKEEIDEKEEEKKEVKDDH